MSEQEAIVEPQDEVKEEIQEEPQEETQEVQEESKEEAKEEKKPKKTIDDRIKEIHRRTAEMRETERRAQEAHRQAQEALQQLKEQQGQLKEPDINDYDDDAKYKEDLSKFYQKQAELNAQKTIQDRLYQNEVQKRQSETMANWEYKRTQEMEKNPEFEMNEMKLTRVLGHFRANHLAQAITESEQGAQLVNYFAKHNDEVEKIAQLPPMSAIKEIGRLEAELSRTKQKTITSAPAPVTLEKGGGGAPNNLANMNFKDFAAMRNKQEFGR